MLLDVRWLVHFLRSRKPLDTRRVALEAPRTTHNAHAA